MMAWYGMAFTKGEKNTAVSIHFAVSRFPDTDIHQNQYAHKTANSVNSICIHSHIAQWTQKKQQHIVVCDYELRIELLQKKNKFLQLIQ